MRSRLVLAAALAAAAAAGIALLATAAGGSSGSSGAGSAAAARAVGTVSARDVRATVTAHRVAGSPPTARLVVDTFRRADGRWRRAASHRVAGTYFWNTVTGPHSICRLELATASPRGGPGHVTVQLLVTPSLGCGKAQTIALPG